MKKDLKKGDIEFEAYGDLFNFHKAYGTPERSDVYWTDMITAASEIAGKYKGTIMGGVVSRHIMELMSMWNNAMKGGQE